MNYKEARKILRIEGLYEKKGKKKVLSQSTHYLLIRSISQWIYDDYKRKETPVVVLLPDGKTAFGMKFAELLIHLFIWHLNFLFNVPIEEDDFHQLIPLDTKRLNDGVLEHITEKFIRITGNIDGVALAIGYIQDLINDLADTLGAHVSNTFSIYEMSQLEDRSKVFKSLFNTKISNDVPVDIPTVEEYIKASAKMLETSIKQDKENCLYPYIEAGRLKTIQLTQMFVTVGPRNDINQKIYPRVVSRNYMHGLQDVGEYYVESASALAALIIKKKYVPDSGYLSRKINLLCLGTDIDWSVRDCGSKHTIDYFVETKSHLNMIIGKYYINEKGQKMAIRGDEAELVGKTLKLRSHVKCALKNGVCETCFGERATLTKGTSIGGLPATEAINPVSQKAMSAKHNQVTNSTEIVNEGLLKLFTINGTSVSLNEDFFNDELIQLARPQILMDLEILEDFIMISDDTKDEEEIEELTAPILTSFIIRYRDSDGKVIETGIENDNVFFQLTPSMLSALSKPSNWRNDEVHEDMISVSLMKETDVIGEEGENTKVFLHEEPLFFITKLSEGVTILIETLKNTIEKKNDVASFNTPDEMLKRLTNIIIESSTGDKGKFIHLETIVYNLVRDAEDNTVRPDYSTTSEPNVSILTLKNAIKKGPVWVSLAFQELKTIVCDPDTFNKMSKSPIDSFFRTVGSLKRGGSI